MKIIISVQSFYFYAGKLQRTVRKLDGDGYGSKNKYKITQQERVSFSPMRQLWLIF